MTKGWCEEGDSHRWLWISRTTSPGIYVSLSSFIGKDSVLRGAAAGDRAATLAGVAGHSVVLLPALASCCLHSIQFGFLGACLVSLNQHSSDCIMRSHPKPYPTKPFLLSSIQAKQKAKDMFKGKRNDEPNVCVAREKHTVLTLASL